MTTLKDIYWLAGYLEGEGSFMIQGCSGSRPGKMYRIMVVSTDRDIIVRAAGIIGGTINRHNGTQKRWSRKVCYSTAITTKKSIGWMMTLYSLMGDRRKNKIKEVINDWKRYESRFQKKFTVYEEKKPIEFPTFNGAKQ